MSLNVTASDSGLTALLARLQQQWEEKLAASGEVREARSSLEFHRRKIQKLDNWREGAREDEYIMLHGYVTIFSSQNC